VPTAFFATTLHEFAVLIRRRCLAALMPPVIADGMGCDNIVSCACTAFASGLQVLGCRHKQFGLLPAQTVFSGEMAKILLVCSHRLAAVVAMVVLGFGGARTRFTNPIHR
jgi:hypothetical protein